MHVKPDSIDECKALMSWIASLCSQVGAVPVLMGDQMDTHGSVRVEVLHFWTWVYYELFPLNKIDRSVSLIGNHDLNYACTMSSMIPFTGVTHLVGAYPELIEGGIYGIGFVKSSDDFVKRVNELPADAKLVLCHQEFNGAMYESGFYAPAGVQPGQLRPGVKFVSGHVHLKQEVGNQILYVGTPRQINRSDSDPDKSVWHLDDSGHLTPIRVPDEVVGRFARIAVREGQEIPAISVPGKTFVDIYGSLDFIKKTMKTLPEEVRVRTFPDRQASTPKEFKESEGIGQALGRYVDLYASTNLKPELKTVLVEKLRLLCPGLF
jgi:hypothetical protein